MKRSSFATLILLAALASACKGNSKFPTYGSKFTLDSLTLMDKIKGGWAGQTIGCTYGGPTEFKYKGGPIEDSIPIVWYDDYPYDIFEEDPGLYDDVYMDLTFVEVMAEKGLDAPAADYAASFANAGYKLWHANQTARYNILHGIMPPESGYWKNNPHADDIDFQIESDFIGMISPGMPVSASKLADKIGHITNCGDGYYGGVYLASMYSYAFLSKDIPFIVSEALKSIPASSSYFKCISDVIALHRQYPDDWHRTWLEVNLRYGNEKGCPEGVFNGFDIDAKMNSAYVVIGLLYGGGDFGKTIDIATRCGEDSDCNPASAAGILGVMNGYDAIPDYWKKSMDKVTDIDFPYTHLSLGKTYKLNYKLLCDAVRNAGGEVDPHGVTVTLEQPVAVPYEEAFKGLKPVEHRVLKKTVQDSLTLEFTGNSVVVLGDVICLGLDPDNSYKAHVDAFIDGQKVETVEMPLDYITRKYDVFYKYCLPTDGKHVLKLVRVKPDPKYVVEAKEMVVYSAVK
jgi:hypothetical protein